MKKDDFEEIFKEFGILTQDLDPLLFVCRDSGLQKAIIPKIHEIIRKIQTEKEIAVKNFEEEKANLLLGLCNLNSAVIAELDCYILLKDNEPDKAWDRLIDAQDGISLALRAHEHFLYLKEKGIRLRQIEYFLFPPQTFLSAGMIVGRQICSICQDDYSKCDHIAGRPYHGQFCHLVLKEVTADHVAIVDEPANRRCRITSFSVPGGRRNVMSWVSVADTQSAPSAEETPDKKMEISGTIASIEDFGRREV